MLRDYPKGEGTYGDGEVSKAVPPVVSRLVRKRLQIGLVMLPFPFRDSFLPDTRFSLSLALGRLWPLASATHAYVSHHAKGQEESF